MILAQQLIPLFLMLLIFLMAIFLHRRSILHMLHREMWLQRGFVSHFIHFTVKRVALQMGFIKCYSWNQTFGFVVGLQGAYNGRDPCPATGSWLMLM